MAVISKVALDLNVYQSISWLSMAAGDTGEVHSSANHADRSVQAVGTFSGGTLSFEGSNDGVNWATLTNLQGDPIAFVAAGLQQISELTRYVRPSRAGGTGSNIDVYFIGKQVLK